MATKGNPSQAFALSLGLLLLAGCSQEKYTAPRNSPAILDAAVTVSEVTIINYGPNPVQAGVPFNVQPNMKAALWMHVSSSLDGSDSAMYLDDVRLQSFISGSQITAAVPAALYAKPGIHRLRVLISRGGDAERTKNVELIVK